NRYKILIIRLRLYIVVGKLLDLNRVSDSYKHFDGFSKEEEPRR
ncbi:unnamed protein product, partial [Arabidopsis halleri]